MAATHDDALGAPLDDMHGLRRRIEGRAVGLRIDQRMGDLEVILAAELDHALGAGCRLGLAQSPESDRHIHQEG